jgi:hypothetical protein
MGRVPTYHCTKMRRYTRCPSDLVELKAPTVTIPDKLLARADEVIE